MTASVVSSSPHALVLGGGAGVWEEVLALEAMLGRAWDGEVIAVNDVGVYWPRPFGHWVTLHPEKLRAWEEARRRTGLPGSPLTWAPWGRESQLALTPWPGGSSGMFAVQVALQALGCRRVVLCGVPMTATPHFAESEERHIVDAAGRWAHADKHWRAWEREAPQLAGAVRSMSGRTREYFGAPTIEWVYGEEA